MQSSPAYPVRLAAEAVVTGPRRRAGPGRLAGRQRTRHLAQRLGIGLRESRLGVRMTQAQASARAGVSQPFWSRLERGEGGDRFPRDHGVLCRSSIRTACRIHRGRRWRFAAPGHRAPASAAARDFNGHTGWMDLPTREANRSGCPSFALDRCSSRPTGSSRGCGCRDRRPARGWRRRHARPGRQDGGNPSRTSR